MINHFRVVSLSVLLALALPDRGAIGQRTPGARTPAVPPATGSVEGDVYLMMKSGDTKRGSGRTISLLRDTPHLHSALDSACSVYRSTWKLTRDSLGTVQKAISDSADAAEKAMVGRADNPYLRNRSDRFAALARAYYDTIETNRVVFEAAAEVMVRTLLRSATSDTVGAGMDAHYRFSRVPAGAYILFGEWMIGDNEYQWWAPITVSAGQALRRDLDNSVEADDKLYCGVR